MKEVTKKVRQYDEEFKKQAVRLYFEQGKSYRILGNELGIPEATLAGWVNTGKYQQGTSGKAVDADTLAELKRLRAELLDVREERDILKKALAIFSQKKKS
jgi:transposase